MHQNSTFCKNCGEPLGTPMEKARGEHTDCAHDRKADDGGEYIQK